MINQNICSLLISPHFQQIIEKQMKTDASLFIRIGKGLIINREYIYKVNVGKQSLILSDMKKQLRLNTPTLK